MALSGGDGGGTTNGTGGTGGSATASFGSILTLTAAHGDTTFTVAGGAGGQSNGSGTGGTGGDALLSVNGALSIDSANVTVAGGIGNVGVGSTGSMNGAGGNSGAAMSGLFMTSNSYFGGPSAGSQASYVLAGGNGGSDTGLGNGGKGGSAALTLLGGVQADSSLVQITGGSGGSSSAGVAGQGGDSSLTTGTGISLSGTYQSSVLDIAGGSGGNGADGGSAALTVGTAITAHSSFVTVSGGSGGNIASGNGGKGGDATAVLGTSLDMVADNSDTGFSVLGGKGGQTNGSGVGGAGGEAVLTVASSVSADTSQVNILGGNANSGYGSSGVTEMAGGDANASLGSMNLTSNLYYGNPGAYTGPAALNLTGGNGGYDSNAGNGGQGGSASLTVSGGFSIDSSQVGLRGGVGGNVSSGTGGQGGNAWVSIGTDLTLGSTYGSSGMNLYGGGGGSSSSGVGGAGGDATLLVSGAFSGSNINVLAGNGSNGGNGGNAIFDANSAALNGSATLTLQAGNGGSAGNAGVTLGSLDLVDAGTFMSVQAGTGTSNGAANVQIGSLAGAGGLFVNSAGNSSLQVSSGDFTGVISGNTGLDKTGAGALTLTADNTYSQATTLDGGVLQFGADANLGASGQLVFNGGTLQAGNDLITNETATLASTAGTIDLNGNAVTWNGVIGGPGSLNVISSAAGSGLLTLSNTNTYAGATSIVNTAVGVFGDSNLGTGGIVLNGGTLAALDNLTLSHSITLLANGGTVEDDANNITLSGIISGSGGLNLEGTPFHGVQVLSLTGANTYSGGTTIGALYLQIQSGADLGTGTVVFNGGILQAGASFAANQDIALNNGSREIDLNGNSVTWNGVISGNGELEVGDSSGSGNGVLRLTNSNTYTNGTLVNGANLWVSSDANLGAASGTLNLSDGQLSASDNINFNASRNLDLTGSGGLLDTEGNQITWNGVISGSGNFEIGDGSHSSTGAVTLTNANTYTGSTVVDLGTSLVLSGNGTLGEGMLGANGTVDFSLTNASAVAGTPVTVSSIIGNGNLYLGRIDLVTGTDNANVEFDGVISDGGAAGAGVTGASLTKVGSGALTLTGENTYSGGTVLQSGTLVAGNSQVFGTGDVALNGGTLQISGPRSLNVGGNYTQSAGATLALGLGPIATSWDTLVVGGTAHLGGTLEVVSYGGFAIHDNETFTIVEAAGVTGTFGSVQDSVPGDAVSVAYNPTDVILCTLANAPSFHSLGTTSNQKQVGSALDNLATGSGSSALITFLNSQSNSALPGEMEKLSPAGLTPLFQMGYASAEVRGQAINARLEDLLGLTSVYGNGLARMGGSPMFASTLPAREEAGIARHVSEDNRLGGFLTGLGDFGTVSGDGNAPGYSFSTGGVQAGIDYWFDRSLVAGLLFGYDQSGTGTGSTASVSGSGEMGGLYAGWKADELRILAQVTGGLDNYSTQRETLGMGGVNAVATGSPQGEQLGGELKVALDLTDAGLILSPFASGQYGYVQVNAFQEAGGGVLAPESFPNQGQSSLSSQLGLKMGTSWYLGDFSLAPSISAAWEHFFQGDLDQITANFGTSGSSFMVSGPATGADDALLGAGLEAQFSRQVTFFAQFQGRVGMTNVDSKNISGGVNLAF